MSSEAPPEAMAHHEEPIKPGLDVSTVLPELAAIGDEELRRQVVEVWQTLWEASEWTDIEEVPVSGAIAVPQIRHTRAVTQMAMAIADIIQDVHGVEVRRDILVAAALVQDACKIVEYEPGGESGARRSAIGQMLGHGPAGAAAARDVGMPLEVVNVILSHSPDAVVPQASLEAKILAFADQVDVAALGGDRFIRKTVQYR